MGMCAPSGGIATTTGRNQRPEGPPNSRRDLLNPDGTRRQSRWFGPDGRAIWDRDYIHSDTTGTHVFPHDHEWVNGERGKNMPGINPEFC